MARSEDDRRLEGLRQKIKGLGETSHRKSYYPQLQKQIDELNQAMRALRESENKHRTLVENLNIGIFRSEPHRDGKIIQANPAFFRMLGFDEEGELLKVAPLDLYKDPEDRDELLRTIKETGKVKDRKIVLKRRDGSTMLCSVTISTMCDGDGNIEFIDGVVEDITEKEMKEEALKQANSKLNLLSSITRHDITNQVMVLEGYLSLVMDRTRDPEDLRLLQRARASVMSIERHIAFTKDYQEIGINAPQWVDLRDALFNALLPLDKTLINVHIEVGDHQIFTDPMIGKVFYNLANNVVKHSKATNLTVSTVEDDGHLLVVFQDDGIGIEDKDRLFKRGSSTSGYGLFLSKEILSITGIGIRETGEPGKGARFELNFAPELHRLPG